MVKHHCYCRAMVVWRLDISRSPKRRQDFQPKPLIALRTPPRGNGLLSERLMYLKQLYLQPVVNIWIAESIEPSALSARRPKFVWPLPSNLVCVFESVPIIGYLQCSFLDNGCAQSIILRYSLCDRSRFLRKLRGWIVSIWLQSEKNLHKLTQLSYAWIQDELFLSEHHNKRRLYQNCFQYMISKRKVRIQIQRKIITQDKIQYVNRR